MTTLDHVPTDLEPRPHPVLTDDELARLDRYRWAYALTAEVREPGEVGYASIADAERVVDRLRFARWRKGSDEEARR